MLRDVFHNSIRFVSATAGGLIAFFLTAHVLHTAGRIDGLTMARVDAAYRRLLAPVLEMEAATAATLGVLAATLAVEAVVVAAVFRRWSVQPAAAAVPAAGR